MLNNESYITFDASKAGTTEIQITHEHKNMIDYFVYVDQPYSEYYDNESNRWINSKEVPQIKQLSDFKKQSLTKSFLIGEIKKIIAKSKRDASKFFQKK